MIVDITEDQMLQVAANAVNASVPVGMGFLQHENKEYTVEDMRSALHKGGVYLDYFHGRMVKMNIKKEESGYILPDSVPTIDYQSWAYTYPTYLDLVQSVVPDVIVL